MFRILLLIFIAVPVIEIALLLQVGSLLGGLNTVLLIITTAVVGAALVKRQGLRNWMSIQVKLAKGQAPGLEVAGGMLLFLAGVCLIIPGFATDILGALLLITPVRNYFAKAMLTRAAVAGSKGSFAQFQFRNGPGAQPGRRGKDADGSVIDGEYSYKKEVKPELEDKDDTKGQGQ